MSATRKRPEKDYEMLKLSGGTEVTVHRVPISLINGIVPDVPKPKRPWVEMDTKGGKQRRPAKSSDPCWDEYQETLDEWAGKKSQLQQDIMLCMALKSYPFPDTLTFDADIMELVEAGLLEIPTNKYSRKAMWLRTYVVTSQNDELELDFALQRLGGVPDEVVQELKDNFRNLLLGKDTSGVGSNATDTDSGE